MMAFRIETIALMVYRIQKIRKRLRHKSNSMTYTPLTNVMRLLIESGLLYTSSIVILFVLYMSSNNGQYGVSDAVGPFFSNLLQFLMVRCSIQIVQIIVSYLYKIEW